MKIKIIFFIFLFSVCFIFSGCEGFPKCRLNLDIKKGEIGFICNGEF